MLSTATTLRFARGDRDAVPGERLSREHADLAERFVGVGEQAEAAEQGQHRAHSLGPAVEFTACEVNEGDHRRHHHTACQACSVVGGEDQPEQLRGQRRDPVVERSVLQVRFARQKRHDPLPVLEHLVHDADAGGVFGFPGIVPDQARQQVGEQKQREQHRCPGKGCHRVHFSQLDRPPPE